jgi:hypothetical protein
VESFPSSAFDYYHRSGRPLQGEELGRQSDVANLPRRLRSSALRESTLVDHRTELRFGRGTIRLSPSLAALVSQMLAIRGTVERDELLSTFFPIREGDCQNFMETLLSWLRETSSLEDRVQLAEMMHNQTISSLYGIGPDRLAVLQRFLAHF